MPDLFPKLRTPKAKKPPKRKARKSRPPEAPYVPPPPPDLPALLASVDSDTGWAIVPEQSRPHRAIDSYARTIHLARPSQPSLRWDEREALQKHYMADAPAEATRRQWLAETHDRAAPPMTLRATCNTPSIYPPGLPDILPDGTTEWVEISTAERKMRGDHVYRRDIALTRPLTAAEIESFKLWLFDNDGGCPGYCAHKLTGAGNRLVAFTTCDTSD